MGRMAPVHPWGPFETLLQNFISISVISPKFQKNLSRGYWEIIWTKFGQIFACPLGTFWIQVFEIWKPFPQLHIHVYNIPKFQNNPSNGNWELVWTKFGLKEEVEQEGHDGPVSLTWVTVDSPKMWPRECKQDFTKIWPGDLLLDPIPSIIKMNILV